MNKTAIKNFAVWARRKLIADITIKAGRLGITENGIAEALPQSTADLKFFDIGTKDYAEVSGVQVKQREALVRVIKEKERDSKSFKDAFEYVVEEVAYTWFNRLIAIRFMEVNDYLPSGIRVLSSENPSKNEPDFVTTPFETDLSFTPYEQDRVYQLKDENKWDELFRMLFIKQCNKLNEILPELFQKTEDYTELLLTISYSDTDGVIHHLVHDIDEKDFDIETIDEGTNKPIGQVEIIGWMYQYYISEKHDKIINIYKGTVKKDDIPAATQLFTTDWVVRYMVDNSLGRYWIERNPQSKLSEKLQFFVTPKSEKINYIDEKVSPEELTFFDPCMGSGHILVYAFDVLMEIYRECGYSDRDAAALIVEKNLFGLDIDKRAYQLAYFAVLMKARSYNRRILSNGIECNLAAIDESNGIDTFYYDNLTTDKEQNKIGEYLITAFRHAKEIGSLQMVEKHDYAAFDSYLECLDNGDNQLDIFSDTWLKTVKPIIKKLCKQAAILSNKYAVVCTNPPYMNKLEGHLKDFVVSNFKAYSGDLFSVFMYRNFAFCKPDGYSAFMTPFVWMFIKTYETLRNFIIDSKSITTLIQMEYSAFEEATVPICSFVLKNGYEKEKGFYFRLSDFKGGMEVQKQKVLEALNDNDCKYFYETTVTNFSKIPGSPIAYWVSKNFIEMHNKTSHLSEKAVACVGLQTSDNKRFLRLWYEISENKIGFNFSNTTEAKSSKYKWFPYNKGGDFRKWYGNQEYVVNWENDGEEIREYNTFLNSSRASNIGIANTQYYFKESGTWGLVSSASFSVRYSPKGFVFDTGGSSVFANSNLKYFIGILNSKITSYCLSVQNPTLNFQPGNVGNIPIIFANNLENITNLIDTTINISQIDWDAFETSWDFKKNPLI